jgi:antitoxin component YwqK of YwqJK toxin-antitoxin module
MRKLVLAGCCAWLLASCGSRGNCPEGAELRGGSPPGNTEQWCETSGESGELLRVGPYSQWYAGGEKKAEGKYEGGKRSGRWTFWQDNGKKKEEGDYKVGKRQGTWTLFHKSGEKRATTEYADDERNGSFTQWHDTGAKKTVGRRQEHRRPVRERPQARQVDHVVRQRGKADRGHVEERPARR